MNGSSAQPLFTLASFTMGKTADRNEDVFGHNDTSIVLSDGATDKAGIRYETNIQTGAYKTGGQVAADIVVAQALASSLNGQELVDTLTRAMADYYRLHSPEALHDSSRRFGASLVAVRIVGAELIVTQLDDTVFRINGQDEYKNDKQIDQINSAKRKAYIEKTGDIPGGRDHIMPSLTKQHLLQNNANDALGYGKIDGSPVPAKFIKTFAFPLADIRTVELVTDGYFGAFPREVSIEAYEKLYRHIEATDPHKIGEFASTKTSDDRTVLILTFARS